MKLSGFLDARSLNCHGCRHDKFHVVPSITAPIELLVKSDIEGCVIDPRLVELRAVPAKRYYEAQDITSGGHSTSNYTNKLVNFQKIKINASMKTNVDHWKSI